MGIKVLGPLAVDGSERLGSHDRVVLQALATRLGQPVSADELIDAIWGPRPTTSAPKNLQSCIVRLRKVLGADSIETFSSGYALVVPPDLVDAHSFEAQVDRARGLLTVGESERGAYVLEQALALWRGPAFPDLPDWPPGRRAAGRLDEMHLEAQEMYLDAMLRSGRAREVMAEAHALVRAAPLRERLWELLVLAQYQSGAQTEALRSVRQLRSVLVRELGIDPSPEMLALEQAILQQDPSLLVPQARAGTGQCPWQGLMAYDVDDTERFFGRDRDTRACLDLLAAGSFAALVGPSGSGKSSIMRAGVLAALRAQGHRIVLVTPGRRPTDALSALPENADARTVLAVDQTEEVFALCEDPDVRREFLDRLAQEAARRPVILTLRGDRLSQVTEHAGFSRLVERGLHLVGALDEEALRAAVTGPAQQAGLVLQPGLVDLLVREVQNDPGALPLMSHALLETWRRREGNTMTVDGYHASGGIHGAVAQSAERLYGSMPDDERHLLRDVVLRLISPGTDGEAVRTQVPRRLIASDPHHERLIEMLVDARLVTSDEGVLEITHEALARAWPRLRGWLDDDVDGQRIRHHLSGAADAWNTLARPDSELYRGVRLNRALDWQDRTSSALTDTEREFLDRARTVAEIEERSAAERARAQARLIRRLRIVLGGATVLLVLALAAGGLAAVQSDRANENAVRAEQAALSADARRVGARAQLTDDISLSLLLAAAGARLDASPETRANLLDVLAKQPLLVRSAPLGGGYAETMEVSHDGRWIAASDDENRMHLYDAATNRLLRSYDAGPPSGGDQIAMTSAFSPDSRQLAVILRGESTEPVRLLDPNSMQPTAKLDFPSGKPMRGIDVQFSADGRYLAATIHTGALAEALETTGYALVWDLRAPSSPPERVPTGIAWQAMALSQDGRTLYTGWPLTAYDVASGETIWRKPKLRTFMTLDVNVKGTLLALERHGPVGAGRGKDGLLVSVEHGDTVATLSGHKEEIYDIQFSPDGRLVGSASADGELIVWRAATGQPLERLDTSAWSPGLSPAGDLVHAGGGDSMLRTWDLSVQDTYLQQTTQVAGAEVFAHADIAPGGQRAAYSWFDGTQGWIRFVDLVTGDATSPTRVPVQEAGWPSGTWHPQGERYVAFLCDICASPSAAVILDPATGKLVKTRDVIDGRLWSGAYVDESRSLLVGDDEGRSLVVDAETLRPQGEPFDVPAHCCTTPIGDGSTALVYEDTADGISEHWRVIDVATGDVLSEGDLNLRAYASEASPDGSSVAVIGDSGELVTIDIETGNQRRGSSGLGAEGRWLHFSDDGERLVSGAADGGVNLWDATTLDLLGTVYPPHRGEAIPAGAQFIGDSHDVAIASYDGRVYRWDTEVDRALDFACQMAGRDLTVAEWEQFLPAQPYESVCPQR